MRTHAKMFKESPMLKLMEIFSGLFKKVSEMPKSSSAAGSTEATPMLQIPDTLPKLPELPQLPESNETILVEHKVS